MGIELRDLLFLIDPVITYYVDYISGNNSNDGLSISTAVQDIYTAITRASAYPTVKKRIVILRPPSSKKGYSIPAPIDINVPNLGIDFGGINIVVGVGIGYGIGVTSSEVALANFSIDNSPDPTGIGIKFFGDYGLIFNAIISSSSIGIYLSGNRIARKITACSLLNCASGIYIEGRLLFLTEVSDTLFVNNTNAIVNNYSNAVYKHNFFAQNIVDYTEVYASGIYISSGASGIAFTDYAEASGTLNDRNHVLIDSNNNLYKILGNADSGVIYISHSDILGNRVSPVPAVGSGYIAFREQIPVLLNNYWDKLVNNSYHPDGDSNRDGIMDNPRKYYPDLGIGPQRSLNVDYLPLSYDAYFSPDFRTSFHDQTKFNLAELDRIKYLISSGTIADRNIRSGMIAAIERDFISSKLITELNYDSGSKYIISTNVKED